MPLYHAPSPASYHAPEQYQRDLQGVFARAWHWVGDDQKLAREGSWWPTTLLPTSLDEPILFTRSADTTRAFANVCTHRAALLAAEPGLGRTLRCPYHGRCFALDGSYKSAHGFGPGEPDLHPVPSETWANHLWASAEPALPFSAVQALLRPLAFADWRAMTFLAEDSRDYEIDAPWATYVENYLEGLHIPFVHPGLVGALDLTDYRIQTFEAGVLQIGTARSSQAALQLPADHDLFGQRIAALYAWIFPGTILNLYPWGASINLVQPMGPSRTRIRYLTYVSEPSLRGVGAGADVHQTETEDQAVVERVARGLRSRWARPATYAPEYEQGVRWFHQLLGKSREP